MATSAGGYALLLLDLLLLCMHAKAAFPDGAEVTQGAAELDLHLEELVKQASAIKEVKELYSSKIQPENLQPVDGLQLVLEMAEKLGVMLGKKMSALKKAVKWAEEVAGNYTWQSDLVIDKVDYVHAKLLNDSTEDYEYNDHFRQRVSLNVSSVHIPVEIYEGDIEILNDLTWSNDLDKQWRENLEDDSELLWQYFGSQSGIMRNFPASRWQGTGVDLYDVRRRPWYTQGASSPKDMMILVDTSGSTHGQALALMKQSVKSLLDTLGENDFVNVASFSDTAKTVGCFDTFVQANQRNKQMLKEWSESKIAAHGMVSYPKGFEFAFKMFEQELFKHVDQIQAHGMANFGKGLEYAFEQFEKFNETDNGEGALCNRIIMFLTDGGNEMPEEVFDKYNPDQRTRIFTYAVGPTANPINAVQWIACVNRGYFAKIPAMGAIRSTVQEHVVVVARPMSMAGMYFYQWSNVYLDALSEYVSVLARPQAMANVKHFFWTNVRLDPWGLGMMTTVTLPVYNRTLETSNQTILGVMGTDVTTEEMRDLIPKRKLGPNGYSFAINNNGYIIFHPNLKAQKGWLTDPPNVDLLDVEYENPQKEAVRKKMIDLENGSDLIQTYVIVPDERHVDNKSRIYSYTRIPGTSFSLAMVVPDYHKYYFEPPSVNPNDGINALTSDVSALLLAPWKYCKNVEPLHNESTPFEDLMDKIKSEYGDCDEQLLAGLFFDAQVTQSMDGVWDRTWQNKDNQGLLDGVEATFVATNGGLTRIYPASANESMQELTDTWDATYYTRAIDNDIWMYTTSYHTGISDPNATSPLIMATRAVTITTQEYKPAVVGVLLSQDKVRKMLINSFSKYLEDDMTLYLLDDGGFVILSSDEEEDLEVGRFFGDIDPHLMHHLINSSGVFMQKEEYDFQASCPVEKSRVNAGIKSVFIPAFYEILTLKWWTAKLAWAYVNFNIYEWLFSKPTDYAFAEEDTGEGNYSCIKHLAQYTLEGGNSIEGTETVLCGTNCTRMLAASRMPMSNLLLVMVQGDCRDTCEKSVNILQAPVKNPLFPDEGSGSQKCIVQHRYRRRPVDCFDFNAFEDTSDCGGGSSVIPSWTLLIAQLVLLTVMLRQCGAC